MQRSTSDVRTRCIHTVKVGGHRLACFVVIIADTVLSNTHLSDKAFESACVRTRCIHMQNFGGHELAEVVISKAFRRGCVHATSPTASGSQHARASPCTNTMWTQAAHRNASLPASQLTKSSCTQTQRHAASILTRHSSTTASNGPRQMLGLDVSTR